MTEARIVLVVFGVLAIALLAMPIATVFTRTEPDPPDRGLDGALSRLFLAGEADPAAKAPPDLTSVLPRGLPQTAAFAALAASNFTCATDSNAATCFRPHTLPGCTEDWKVRVIFTDAATVWSSQAERKPTCP